MFGFSDLSASHIKNFLSKKRIVSSINAFFIARFQTKASIVSY